MQSGTQSPAQDLPKLERAQNKSGFFSSDSVLSILNLILAGSELSEVLTIGLQKRSCPRFVEGDDGTIRHNENQILHLHLVHSCRIMPIEGFEPFRMQCLQFVLSELR
jgi:hypothetical protein